MRMDRLAAHRKERVEELDRQLAEKEIDQSTYDAELKKINDWFRSRLGDPHIGFPDDLFKDEE